MADSTIRVNIIGDAKSLQRAAGTAEASIAGINKTALKAGGIIAGAFVVDALVDFGSTAVKEADRVADAADRLEKQLGPELSKAIIDRADDFSRFGASKGDMLELEARIADIGTAAGIADRDLAPFAESAAEIAAKMALATDIPADEWIDKIGKAAASGDARSLRDLGINLSDTAVAAQALADTGKPTVDALTETELAAARVHLIMGDLQPRYGDVGTAAGDLEQKQAELNAKWETLTGEIGGPLTDLLSDVLDFVLRGVDGWGMLADKLDDANVNFDNVTTGLKLLVAPLTTTIDLVNTLVDAFGKLFDLTSGGPVGKRVPRLPTGGGLSGGGGLGPNTVNVHVQGGSPEVIEQSVRRAVNGIARRSGALE